MLLSTTYHSSPHHCHLYSLVLRHRLGCRAGIDCLRHTDENSPPSASYSSAHQSGPGTATHRHTPGSGRCTPFRVRTGTGLRITHCIRRIKVFHTLERINLSNSLEDSKVTLMLNILTVMITVILCPVPLAFVCLILVEYLVLVYEPVL